MNKLRAYFRVICAPIRPSIFRHSRQANSVLATRKFETAARNFEPVARNFVPAHYVPAQNFYLSIWVTMSAMPPADNYISIFLLKKTWQTLDIKMVVVYQIQMWNWIVMIFYATYFLEHVEC